MRKEVVIIYKNNKTPEIIRYKVLLYENKIIFSFNIKNNKLKINNNKKIIINNFIILTAKKCNLIKWKKINLVYYLN